MTTIIQKLQRLLPFRLLLIVALSVVGLLQFLLMMGNIQGQNYNVKLFQVSPETIRAVKTVEDTEQTKLDKQAAADSVEPVYTYSEEVGKNQASVVRSIYNYALDAKEIEATSDSAKAAKAQQKKQLEALKKSLDSKELNVELSDEDLAVLLAATKSELEDGRDSVVEKVTSVLQQPVREADVAEKRESIGNAIRLTYSFPTDLMNVSIRIARSAMVANELLDEDATEQKRQQAIESIDPTRILQGQIIVQEGEVIDRDVYHQLEVTGMLATHQSLKPYVGLALLIIIQMLFFYMIFNNAKNMKIEHKIRNLLIVSIIYVLSIGFMELLGIVDREFDLLLGFLFPAALAPMMIRMLVGERIAVLVTMMLGISAGVIFQEGYSTVMQMEIALYMILSGISSLYFVRNMQKRSKVLQTSFGVAIVNSLFIAFYLLMTQSSYTAKELLFYLVAAIVSALLSGALTIGTLPFIETVFGILSSLRLIELSSPNHPLLKKILMEAPGTYHHSIMVANLAEAACEAVGADGLLARVGCYYHDIGKTKRPGFFVENQTNGLNPHDHLPPEKSRDIIIAHAADGVRILEKHKMPKEIVDIARQHHGTTAVKFFYYKAKQQDPTVKESDYRYAGPKPQTKEIAIITVADSVEAAVRSMKDPTPEKIKNLVHAIAQDKLQDGQFDECDLTIQELHTIEQVFCETLNGTFHSRIEYPEPNE
ncbi:HD family phosphohydrolase [Kurthia populi]|uniref:HD family phosphohydrolase n=1 Tax=Kurthia populi TaxID=1562132 RepID=A0ABW5Y1C1_9BACL|nr:HD family phosphohydrolase [Kurthia sp. Dielmo]HIX44245.1 HD family phosphohydrolase [Candidatus Kurthia intestinigallinarum]